MGSPYRYFLHESGIAPESKRSVHGTDAESVLALPHLQFHSGAGCPGKRYLLVATRWLRAAKVKLYRRPTRETRQISIQVGDLAGNPVYSNSKANRIVDLPLPAGAYRVTAPASKTPQGYTLKLIRGKALRLYLRPSLVTK